MTNSLAQLITVIGSINTDMVVKTKLLPRPGETVLGTNFFISAGGKGANQAVAASRLGGRVSLVANVGNDSFGDDAIRRLEKEGIDCHYIRRTNNSPSGVALISVDNTGANQIVVAPGANSAMNTNQLKQVLSTLQPQSIILIQLETPLEIAEYVTSFAKLNDCKVILDPAPACVLSQEILRDLYLITPNEGEAETLTGVIIRSVHDAEQAAHRLLESGVQNVAITLGENGVLLADQKRSQHITAGAVNAVDTTAAGDCFNGALAVALARRSSIEDAARFACRAAALSVTRSGAQDSMPRAIDLA